MAKKKARAGRSARSVQPNAGIRAAYYKRLSAIVKALQVEIATWLTARYQAVGDLAADGPMDDFRDSFGNQIERWQSGVDDSASKQADWFAGTTQDYADRALKSSLADVGFSVPFKTTEAVQATFQAVAAEQVALIKSIASQHLTQVETLVMQSVQNGRDLKFLTDELQQRYELTRRRAELIARDQNNKATSVITRARHQQLGITQAKWRHSAAGRKPRPSHVHADGKVYDVDKGMLLDGVWTWPGIEINCHCSCSPIIPGLD